MKMGFRGLIVVILAMVTSVALLVGGATFFVYTVYTQAGALEKSTTIAVPQGAHIGQVAAILQEAEVIASPDIFTLVGRVTGAATQIQAGHYAFSPYVSMQAVLDKMVRGDIVVRSVTIPEGLTSYEIMRILRTVDGLAFDVDTLPVEGSLLPETYQYIGGQPASALVAQMQKAKRDVLDAAWGDRAEDLPFETRAEALVLASIIEKETAVPSERRRVAGVFVNRLRKGMRLQTDPTVIYGITQGRHDDGGSGPLGRRILRKDLQYDSPFNTYLYAGLPPHPIANAGKESIEAALNPENHDYIFFVADGTGGHAFAKTLAEHNRNVAQWRRIRDQ